jgi:hypothetical protein
MVKLFEEFWNRKNKRQPAEEEYYDNDNNDDNDEDEISFVRLKNNRRNRKNRRESSKQEVDYSMIDKNSISLVPFGKFHPVKEIKDIIKSKISLLESDEDFQIIMEMIKSHKIRNFKKEPQYYGTYYELTLNSGDIVGVGPMKSWEKDGDYDIYYIMSFNDQLLGYISYENYNIIINSID